MNQLVTINNGQPVTTSTIIASGADVEHKAVIQLIRTYLSDLSEFGRVTFEMAPFETAGGTQKREIALLNEQQSTLLLTYMRNTEIVRGFKKRLVKAFFDLARQAVKPAIDPMQVLSDPAAMRGLLLNYTEKVIALENKVQEQTPKVEGFDRLATVAQGSFCIRDAAKSLQVQEKQLIQLLIEERWVYRRPMGSGMLAYSDKLQQGLMEHKVTTGEKSDGSEWTSTQARITVKGLTKLSLMLSSIHQFSRPIVPANGVILQ